jgi:hypothetical protein
MKLIFEEVIPGTVKLGDHIRAVKDLNYDERVFTFQYAEHNYALIRRDSENVFGRD